MTFGRQRWTFKCNSIQIVKLQPPSAIKWCQTNCRVAFCRCNGKCREKCRHVLLYQEWPSIMKAMWRRWIWASTSATTHWSQRFDRFTVRPKEMSDGWCPAFGRMENYFRTVAETLCWPMAPAIWPIDSDCAERIWPVHGLNTIYHNWNMHWNKCRMRSVPVSTWS